jgi:hypothetical protein
MGITARQMSASGSMGPDLLLAGGWRMLCCFGLACHDRNERRDMVGWRGDIPSGRGTSTRGVPTVLATGYDVANLPENFQGVPHLRKPFHDTDVRRLARMFFRRPKS